MTIYWRVGKFVLGIYVIVQTSILILGQFPIDTEAIQSTGNTLLNNYLHQRLSEYYYKVSQNTEVWSAPSIRDEVNVLLDTLFSGSVVAVLDSASTVVPSQSQWLKIAYQGEHQAEQTGWITRP